ncbi:MAG: diacylglycerol kinase [Novosphingobium sp.]|nr:diacylglycerol kinase [Novosphingobium sp.]
MADSYRQGVTAPFAGTANGSAGLSGTMDLTPLWLVTNAASGSNSDAAVDELAASLGASGCAPDHVIRFPDEDLPTGAALRAAGVRTLAVFTGDGTINSAATAAEGWDGAILVLPGGTMNLLSKTLHGDVPAAAVVDRLVAGTFRRISRPAVRTSQGTALVEVLAGPGAMWADVREGVRDFDLGAIAETFSNALRETREGSGVVLANPPAGKPDGYRALRVAPEDSGLLVEGYDFADLADFAAQGFAMLVKRDFRQGPHDELGHFATIDCRSDSPIALMIDGERRQGKTGERLERIEFPVDFIATGTTGD